MLACWIMNTEHVVFSVHLHPCLYSTWSRVLAFLFVCARHLSGPGRLERNSQSSCQGSQMGCELLIQKIVSVLERPSFQTLPSLTSADVLSVMCQACVVPFGRVLETSYGSKYIGRWWECGDWLQLSRSVGAMNVAGIHLKYGDFK